MLGVEPRGSFVELNRTRLRVWEWGEPGDPPVIFAHGAYDHGRMWDDFAPRIAALGYRCVAIDFRGHGDSGRLSSGAMWSASALDLACLARELRNGNSVGIIGHSFGAGQSMYAAGVWPELFRWVVNLDGMGNPDTGDGFEAWDLVEAATNAVDSAERFLARGERSYPSLADMADRRGAINVRLPREWVEHLVEHGARPAENGDGFVWKFDPMFRVGFPGGEWSPAHARAEHAMVTQPILVITGAEHDTWSELTNDDVEERIGPMADVRHAVVPGAGHYVHIEQPAVVAELVARFLAEVDPR
ncbi:MAG TPA: alpha/beta hydrolase [Acidimicrobiales bacterium]|nr:alpha/beta hydrolase [Acidimicrobiales bacterium]